MRYNLIFNILGLISKYIGLMFVFPIAAAFFLKETSEIPFYFITGLFAIVLGVLFSCNKTCQRDIDNIKKSESLAVVFFSWVLFGLICSIPYLFYGFNFTNAVFEAVSGVTTTGGTIIEDFGLYSKTLFFFRSLTQWFGGMGIVVLFIAVLPKISVAGRQMFYAEAPMPTQDKVTPRIRYTASWFWGLYLAFTLIEIAALRFFNLDFYDATVTSLSTISTGGFSPFANSIIDFGNHKISICILIFMLIAGINYILMYRALKSKKTTPFAKSEEFKVYVAIVLFTTLLLALSLFFNNHYTIQKSFLYSCFEIVATLTSTGFALDNYINWDAASKVILFATFFIGGCATSTSGGIKIIRWIFVAKYLKRELNKIIHPQGVYPIKLEGTAVDKDVASQMIAFVVFYLVIFALGAFFIVLLENNTTLALSASAAAIGNIGPGFGSIGPMDNYFHLHFLSKWIIILLMLIGRLEIIPFLAVLNKDLWKS